MFQTIIRENTFNGKYVAMKSFDDKEVVGEGSTPQEAYKKALKKGYENPVITFIPAENMVQIY
jgi:hypothetical protein